MIDDMYKIDRLVDWIVAPRSWPAGCHPLETMYKRSRLATMAVALYNVVGRVSELSGIYRSDCDQPLS